MRENSRFKFRAWDKMDLCMHDWRNLLSHRYGKDEDNIFNDSDYVIMQFTGLKDKNGKEIYEGDVVNYPVNPTEFNKNSFGIRKRIIAKASVVWEQDDAMFSFHFQPEKNVTIILGQEYHMSPCYEVIRACDEDIEVIGNIYEHPELLQRHK